MSQELPVSSGTPTKTPAVRLCHDEDSLTGSCRVSSDLCTLRPLAEKSNLLPGPQRLLPECGPSPVRGSAYAHQLMSAHCEHRCPRFYATLQHIAEART
jgi:hypothetical protein